MALSFDNARTSLVATLSSAAIAAGGLAGCGGGQSGSQKAWVPPTEKQAAHCQELYNTGREDAQKGIDDATPGGFAKIGDAIGGNQRRQVPVDTANQTGERRYRECMDRATISNTNDAEERAHQQAQATAANTSQPAASSAKAEESTPSYAASTNWTEKMPSTTALERVMCKDLNRAGIKGNCPAR